jgi:hypothetical protein
MPTPSQLKTSIDTQITNKTQPYSISNVDTGNRLKDIIDLITVPDVITVTDDFTIAITAGKVIDSIIIVPSSGSQTINIGTTSGGSQIVDSVDVSAGDPLILVNKYFTTDNTVYVSGITVSCTVKIIYK